MNLNHPFYCLTLFLVLIFECNCQLWYTENTRSQQQQFQQYPQQNFYNGIQFSPLNVRSTSLSSSEPHDQTISDKISRNILQLGQELFRRVNAKQKSKALILSPISMVSALSLLLLGSNGETFRELKRIFDLNYDDILSADPYKLHKEFALLIEDVVADVGTMSRIRPQPSWRSTYQQQDGHSLKEDFSNPSDYHQIRIANGIFVQNGFSLRKEYMTVVKNAYRSKIVPLEFHSNPVAAKNYINDWVDKNTHGKIKEIISSPIAAETNVIVASALYFKALWERPFFDFVLMENFYPQGLNGPSLKVEMMPTGGVFPYYDAKEYGCVIIGLPYKGNVSTMYVIQPYDSSTEKLRRFQASLTANQIENMISKMVPKTTVMIFPKLHITSDIDVKQIFMDLGIQALFTSNKCDLSLMTDSPLQSNLNNQHLIRVPVYATQTNRDGSLAFSRFGNIEQNQSMTENYVNLNRGKRAVTYKVESSFKREVEPLRLKDFVLNKRITKHNPGKKLCRSRRQVDEFSINSIKYLDSLRDSAGLRNPHLFVGDIVHKVDLIVNAKGTEGGAATAAYVRRSGTDVVFRGETPFLILIRHDLTKLPLFYGAIYEPTNF